MRIVSQDGLVDVPYEQAVLVAQGYHLLPFVSEDESTEPYDVYDLRVFVERAGYRAIIARIDSEIVAIKVLEMIRKHYIAGEKVVYLDEVLSSALEEGAMA